jgi:putative SbcD/Mre11-related phosphoesterase
MMTWGDWLLTPARAAIHRPSDTAVVADLHLGYAEARRRGGEAVPLPSLEDTLSPLAGVLAECEVRSLVVAGDLFEAGPDPDVVERFLAWLDQHAIHRLTIVPGNHDCGLKNVPPRLQPAQGPVLVGDWLVVHGDDTLPDGAVVHGHLHPGIRITRGVPLLPCFLMTAGHLILPACSPEAAGVDVSRQTSWQGYRCVAVVGSALLDVGEFDSLSTTRTGSAR